MLRQSQAADQMESVGKKDQTGPKKRHSLQGPTGSREQRYRAKEHVYLED